MHNTREWVSVCQNVVLNNVLIFNNKEWLDAERDNILNDVTIVNNSDAWISHSNWLTLYWNIKMYNNWGSMPTYEYGTNWLMWWNNGTYTNEWEITRDMIVNPLYTNWNSLLNWKSAAGNTAKNYQNSFKNKDWWTPICLGNIGYSFGNIILKLIY